MQMVVVGVDHKVFHLLILQEVQVVEAQERVVQVQVRVLQQLNLLNQVTLAHMDLVMQVVETLLKEVV